MKHFRFIFVLILFILMTSLQGGAHNSQSAIEEFRAQEGTGWIFHLFDDGRVRSMYGFGGGRRVSNEIDAKLFFADYAELFGIQDQSHLRLESIEKDSGTSYIFRQYFFGLPVVGGELALHTDVEGHVLAAGGQYHSMKRLDAITIDRRDEARVTASRIRFADGVVSNGTLMILPGFTQTRIVWKFEAISNRFPGQWAIYVDALLPDKVLRVQREFFEVQATGTVFPENPVVTPDVSNERFLHLKDSNRLNGKYTKIYNANFQLPFPRNGDLNGYTTAAESDEDYSYPTSDARFAEAMGYFHINVVHDRWRSFGFQKLNRQIPVFVNIVTGIGKGFDNAFYTRGGRSTPFKNGAIVMGAGDRLENLGHDADVYYHEYGHAVLDFAKPGFLETFESNYAFAFHEGFSDISASAITGNSKLAEFGLRLKSTGRFQGRNLENNNRYPQDVILKGLGKSESHHTGLIVGGAWWDLQKQIGIDTAQNILYHSLAILPNDMNFFDLRNSMLTADLRKNGGANGTAIQSAFAKHGIDGEDPGQKGTIQTRSLKTARLNFSNFKLTLKSTFKRGDYIIVLASYSGTGLTPGYNLISDLQITGPPNMNVDAFPFIDEVSNGLHLGKKGAWVAELGTYDFSARGEYTVTLRSRLGGTSTLTETKTVKFKLTE